MWAVGRLSLLSREQTRTEPRVAAPALPTPPKPLPELRPASVVAPPVPSPAPVDRPAPEPVPVAVQSTGVLQRIVNRVSRFFRSLFG